MNSVWGPAVWTLLHRLSFYSNRKDITGAWKNVLRLLSDTIPCALCRKHMKEYLVSNQLVFTNIQESNKIRETIIVWLFNFHNNVNMRLGKEAYPYELLELTYGQGMHEAAVKDAKRLMVEIEGFWQGSYIRDFKLAVAYLCGLINGGPF
jgi:hypothetical protein